MISRDDALQKINTILASNRRFQTTYTFVLLADTGYCVGYLRRLTYTDGVYHVLVQPKHEHALVTLSYPHLKDFFTQVEHQFAYYQMQDRAA